MSETSKDNSTEVFLAPYLVSNIVEGEIKSEKNNTSAEKTDGLKNNITTVPSSYNEPHWKKPPKGEEISKRYYIEVIKEGAVVEVIKLHNLTDRSYWCIGRFGDIRLDHPSVSRHHLILQYGELIRGNPRWFIYDLGSTHGTRLNKTEIKKRTYIPLHSGSIFQVAGSSRIFSMCCDIDQQEGLNPESSQHSTGCESPERNEDPDEAKFYLKDPIFWLKKYFEREGMEMNFQFTSPSGLEGRHKFKRQQTDILDNVDEKNSLWTCTLELANEVSLSGGSFVVVSAPTRKLAHLHCAISACERLDEAALLRVSSIWNKAKTYEDNDYYDSDEDLYFDRTGQIEIQRERRKKRLEGQSEERAKTYDDLLKDLELIEEKMETLKSEICRLSGKDNYDISTAEFGEITDHCSKPLNLSTRMAISQLRSKQKKLFAEKESLRKLIDLVRPRNIEDIVPLSKPPAPKIIKIEDEEISQFQPISKVLTTFPLEDQIALETSSPRASIITEQKPTLLFTIKSELDDETPHIPISVLDESNQPCTSEPKFYTTKPTDELISDASNAERGERIYGPALLPQENAIITATANHEQNEKLTRARAEASESSEKYSKSKNKPSSGEREYGPVPPSFSQRTSIPEPNANSTHSHFAATTSTLHHQQQPKKYGILTKEEMRAAKLYDIKLTKLVKSGGLIIKEKKPDLEELTEIPKEDLSLQFNSQEKYATWLPPEDQLGDGNTRLNKKFIGRY